MFKFFKIILVFVCIFVNFIKFAESKEILSEDKKNKAASVAILPFKIYSDQADQANQNNQNKDYLQNEILKSLKKQLSQEGAIIIDLPANFSNNLDISQNLQELKKYGSQKGANYLISGSLTVINSRFNFDVKLINCFEQKGPFLFSQDGQGLENIAGVLGKISKIILSKIFKQERISKINIIGNKRVEADAIKGVIKTNPGDNFSAKTLSEDLKAIFAMGFFDDILIDSQDSPNGKIITFRLKEKPTIRFIKIINNKVLEEKEITDSLTLKTGAVLNIFDVQNNIKRIESLYKEKNYHNVKINYNIKEIDNNQADLEFAIQEGDKIKIKQISFLGNKAVSSKELKKNIKISEAYWLSWLTGAGDFKPEDLNQDAAKLLSFYQNSGYAEAKVAEPLVDYKSDGIYITFKIDEGERFEIGEVKIEGDLVKPYEELNKLIAINKEKYYNREIVRKDIISLSDVCSNEGYAYVDIIPKISKTSNKMNIAYVITKGGLVYFDKIIIAGNIMTRDKVIRRELKVYEQELFKGQKLKESIRNLQRLDFFEDVKVDTIKGLTDDTMNLKLTVKEKQTGVFSFGGGYSNVENVFAMASISQRNLFGLGQILQLKAEIGGTTARYTLSFTEPYLFDMPLTAGFDIYNWSTQYDTYDKESKGGGIRFGYLLFDNTSAYLSYNYDVSNITNITEDASQSVRDLKGENITSSVRATIRYDSRDRIFNPTEGMDHSLSCEYAGLGGTVGYIKYVADSGLYVPLFWETVFYLHGKGGYIEEIPGKMLPDYERFYLGGINSVRGYKWQDLHALDSSGVMIGGHKFVQFNAEYIIPLVKKAGVMGVLFFDAGDVFGKSDNIKFDNMKESVGFGFRWYSPMGPMRIEYGHILNPKENQESKGRWEFTVGGNF